MFRSTVMIEAALIDVLVVVGAVWFVIRIVSPSQRQRIVRTAYEAAAGSGPGGGASLPASTFYHDFISLERSIRDYLRDADLYVPSQRKQAMSFSFRQMVLALYQNEIITTTLRDRLLKINRVRNLLFHGHIDAVSTDVCEELRSTKQMWVSEKRRPIMR
jgi:hypothetical protein